MDTDPVVSSRTRRGWIDPELGTTCLVAAIKRSMINTGGKLPAKPYSFGLGIRWTITCLTLLMVVLVLTAVMMGITSAG